MPRFVRHRGHSSRLRRCISDSRRHETHSGDISWRPPAFGVDCFTTLIFGAMAYLRVFFRPLQRILHSIPLSRLSGLVQSHHNDKNVQKSAACRQRRTRRHSLLRPAVRVSFKGLENTSGSTKAEQRTVWSMFRDHRVVSSNRVSRSVRDAQSS